ncbi:hypothetical protein H1P_2370016 [Hyella patelloides LEGE 07179]|uniref:Uncharacterized protein n=1 Tax=Hyella patelloides LEGE 07179 TaxID=945734 RepID=A0A563VRS1_9CYAN|nr:hypothetical protein H1P_2370016 [Hyella patelloides LEGE 07179]
MLIIAVQLYFAFFLFENKFNTKNSQKLNILFLVAIFNRHIDNY